MGWARVPCWLVAFALVALLFAATADAASESAPGLTRADAIPSPQAFYVYGSHGYVVAVEARRAERGRPNEVFVRAYNRDGAFYVSAPADLRGEGIHANLGRFGRIDLAWSPTGRAAKALGECDHRRFHLYIDEGSYVGRFSFRGYRGFTRSAVDRISGRRGWPWKVGCGIQVAEGFPGPGVLLEAFRYSAREPKGAYREFSAVQNRPGARVSYSAWTGMRSGRLSLNWEAYASGPGVTLTHDPSLDAVQVSPPPPFSGDAAFERVAMAHPGRWRGSLAVDFPGRPGVPLAGADFGAKALYGYREVRSERQKGERSVGLAPLFGYAEQRRHG